MQGPTCPSHTRLASEASGQLTASLFGLRVSDSLSSPASPLLWLCTRDCPTRPRVCIAAAYVELRAVLLAHPGLGDDSRNAPRSLPVGGGRWVPAWAVASCLVLLFFFSVSSRALGGGTRNCTKRNTTCSRPERPMVMRVRLIPYGRRGLFSGPCSLGCMTPRTPRTAACTGPMGRNGE